MNTAQTRQTLKTVLEWMVKNNQFCIDSDYVSYGIWPDPKKADKSIRLTFPLPLNTYKDFHKSLGQEFTEEFYDAYQDRGFGEEYLNEADGQMWRFPENRIYFQLNDHKFIWRWMTGQGEALQIIMAGKYERAPFDDSKLVKIT